MKTLSLSPVARHVIEALIIGYLVARAAFWLTTIVGLRWMAYAIATGTILIAAWRQASKADAAQAELERLRAQHEQDWNTVTDRFDAAPEELPDDTPHWL